MEEVVSGLLVEEVNNLRKKEGLQALIGSETLDAIAFDQAEYISKLGKITHEQDQEKKKTLLDRILFYEGLNAQAGENAVIVGVGSKEQIEVGGVRVLINTEANAVKAAIVSWLGEEEGRLNLLDPHFYEVGTAVIIQENKEIIFVLVTASLPYLPPNSKKVATNFHGVNSYSDENCKTFLENNSTIPQLFSDAITVEKGEAFFNYHSLDYINELINSSSDGIALDIVRDSQFDCSEGNRLFPSDINDGYLMHPAKKGKLNAYNLLKEKGEVKLSLGVLPDFYTAENCELNLVIIKKGSYCETVPYNRLESKNLNWFNTPHLLAGKSDTNFFAWNDSSVINIPLGTNIDLKAALKTQLDLLRELNYDFQSVYLETQVTPIGVEGVGHELDSFLMQELGEIYFSSSHQVAWEAYSEFQKGTFHQLETEGMSQEEIKAYLQTQNDEGLSKFRNEVNQLHLTVKGRATLSNSTSKEAKVVLLKRLIKDQRIKPAEYLQSNLIQEVLDKKMSVDVIPQVDPSQKKNTLTLINNQIVLQQALGELSFDGNPIHLAFLELFLIDKKQTEVSFNKHISELKYWSTKPTGMKSFESWPEGFRALSAAVPAESYARGFLNYHLIAADYYYDKGDFSKRKKAFVELMKWQSRANLNKAELLDLAKYLCFQDQFSKAIELLIPEVKGKHPDEKLLYYFLQIAIYDQVQVNAKAYLQALVKAKELYPGNFCSLFSKEKAGIQLLKDHDIKALYCAQCKNE